MKVEPSWMELVPLNEDAWKREPQCTVGGSLDWYSHYGKHYGASLKN